MPRLAEQLANGSFDISKDYVKRVLIDSNVDLYHLIIMHYPQPRRNNEHTSRELISRFTQTKDQYDGFSNQNDSFIHLRTKGYGTFVGRDIVSRFYINTSAENHKALTDAILAEAALAKLPIYMKLDVSLHSSNRNEGILLYGRESDNEKIWQLLNQVEAKYPELVDLCGKPPVMSMPLNGWIGYGDEPRVNSKQQYSFNSLREQLIVAGQVYAGNLLIKEIGHRQPYENIIKQILINKYYGADLLMPNVLKTRDSQITYADAKEKMNANYDRFLDGLNNEAMKIIPKYGLAYKLDPADQTHRPILANDVIDTLIDTLIKEPTLGFRADNFCNNVAVGMKRVAPLYNIDPERMYLNNDRVLKFVAARNHTLVAHGEKQVRHADHDFFTAGTTSRYTRANNGRVTIQNLYNVDILKQMIKFAIQKYIVKTKTNTQEKTQSDIFNMFENYLMSESPKPGYILLDILNNPDLLNSLINEFVGLNAQTLGNIQMQYDHFKRTLPAPIFKVVDNLFKQMDHSFEEDYVNAVVNLSEFEGDVIRN